MNNTIEQLAQQVKEEYGIEGDLTKDLCTGVHDFAKRIKLHQELDKKREEVKKKLEPLLNEYGSDLVEEIFDVLNHNTLEY